jgi:hypothetical protein
MVVTTCCRRAARPGRTVTAADRGPVEGGRPAPTPRTRRSGGWPTTCWTTLAELEARVAVRPDRPDAWHASTTTTAADLAPFTSAGPGRGQVAAAAPGLISDCTPSSASRRWSLDVARRRRLDTAAGRLPRTRIGFYARLRRRRRPMGCAVSSGGRRPCAGWSRDDEGSSPPTRTRRLPDCEDSLAVARAAVRPGAPVTGRLTRTGRAGREVAHEDVLVAVGCRATRLVAWSES